MPAQYRSAEHEPGLPPAGTPGIDRTPSSSMNGGVSRLLRTVLPLLIVGLLVSLAAGHAAGLALIAIGLVALNVSQIRNLVLLAEWLRHPRGAVPGGTGAWEDVFAGLHKYAGQGEHDHRALSDVVMHFREAAEALPDGIVILDRNHKLEWANTKARDYLRISLLDEIHQSKPDLLCSLDAVGDSGHGESGNLATARICRVNGRVLSLKKIAFGQNENLLIARDITEFERVDTVRRDFVANVSRELKTPLAVLAGSIDTARNTLPDTKEGTSCLGLMIEQTTGMQRLVDDLLVLSGLENRSKPLHEEPVEIRPLLESVQAYARHLSGGRHDITLDIACDSTITGDEAELKSAFSNLVSNAVRYTLPGGSAQLRWEVNEREGVFSVTDSGIGIEAQHIPRLTERLYRVEPARSRATGGTGLGLAIVKHVLARHHAKLRIASEPGKGSRFSTHFPATRVAAVRTFDRPAATD